VTGTLILLLLGDGAAPPGMRRLVATTRWDAWSAPALLAVAVLCGAASGWLHLYLTRPQIAAGQVWAARRRTLSGLTVRIVSQAPGPLVGVVLTPPCDPRLHGTAGTHIALSRRGRSVRGWRLIAVPAADLEGRT
jgi:hypothetical protein